MPVRPYIYKWLCNRHGYNKVLEVNRHLSPYFGTNTSQVYIYFRNWEEYPTIRISAYYPNRLALYSFVQWLELWFNQEMLSYVRAATLNEYPAKLALADFLQLCGIEEEELQLATAYKRWQRAGLRGLPGIKVN